MDSPIQDEMTVVETVYHRSQGEEPTQFDSRFVRKLRGREQPYIRRIVVGETPQQLDFGWVDQEEVGAVVLRNEEGKHLQVQPTSQEREDISSKVVMIWYAAGSSDDYWSIPPGESFRGTPSNAGGLMVRAARGQAKCTLLVIPA